MKKANFDQIHYENPWTDCNEIFHGGSAKTVRIEHFSSYQPIILENQDTNGHVFIFSLFSLHIQYTKLFDVRDKWT